MRQSHVASSLRMVRSYMMLSNKCKGFCYQCVYRFFLRSESSDNLFTCFFEISENSTVKLSPCLYFRPHFINVQVVQPYYGTVISGFKNISSFFALKLSFRFYHSTISSSVVWDDLLPCGNKILKNSINVALFCFSEAI